jgi:hypothetical protein
LISQRHALEPKTVVSEPNLSNPKVYEIMKVTNRKRKRGLRKIEFNQNDAFCYPQQIPHRIYSEVQR